MNEYFFYNDMLNYYDYKYFGLFIAKFNIFSLLKYSTNATSII